MSIEKNPPFRILPVFLPALILALPVLAYFGWQYWHIPEPEPVNYPQILTGYLKRMPPIDKLNEKYVDADGDLVPDGPKNPADRIDPAELVFTPGNISASESEADWREFTDHMAKVTSKKVTFTKVDSPADLLEQLTDGKIHVTSFSTGSVPTAVNLAGFVPAAALASADGASSYTMEIIVPAASPIKTPADLKGKKLALTSTGSHSGYKAPLMVLKDEFHLQPGVDYQFLAAGSHAGAIAMVATHQADAAAVAADVLADAVAAGKPLKADEYRAIFTSKAFPKGAWGYTCLLKPELAGKVREAFLTFPFAGSKLAEKFKGSKAVKFAPINYKKDWAYVRDIDAKMLAWR